MQHFNHFVRLGFFLLVAFTLCLLNGCAGVIGSGLQKQSSSVQLYVSATSLTEGQQEVLIAYMSPDLATGTVTFYNGSKAIGTATINFGLNTNAQLYTTFSSTGTMQITAKYNGSVFFDSSTSNPVTVGVYSNNLTPTNTSLKLSSNTPTYNTNVTLTANVSPAAATGAVTFFSNGASVGSAAVNNGTATTTIQFPAGGNYQLTAVYSGDFNNASSTSSAVSVNVNGPLVTSITLFSSTTATAANDPVTLTASVYPNNATGTVTFYNGSTAIGTSNLAGGQAILNTSFSTSGQISVQASMNANSSFEASNSNVLQIFVTGDTPSATSVVANPDSIVIGYSTWLTATVTPPDATGTVNFYDGTVLLGSGGLSGGTTQYYATFGSTGQHTINAIYSGDATYLASNGNTVLTVGNPGNTPTSTLLNLTYSEIYAGQADTLTANITPSTATGQVTFYSGDVVLGTATVSDGTAAFSTTFNYSGVFELSAVYDGDPTYNISTSPTVELSVDDNSDLLHAR